MKHVTNVKREKDVFNISLEEFKKGKWLDKIKDASDMVEISYKNHYLTISDCQIKRTKNSEMENRGEKRE